MKKILCGILAVIVLTTSFGAALAAGNTGNEYNWRQGDWRWKNVTNKISWGSACAVTAIAIQIARSGLVYVDESATDYQTATKQGFNPGTFAKAWYKSGGLTSSASVTWGTVSKVVSGFNHATDSRYRKASSSFSYYPATKTGSRSGEQQIVDSLTAFFNDGYSIIVEGPGSGFATRSSSRHYVAVVEADGTNVYVIDSIDGKRKNLFDVQPGSSSKTRWTANTLNQCGSPAGYACCVLYKADSNAVVKREDTVSSITLRGESYPSGTYKIGEKFYFKGTISSAYSLRSVYGGIYDKNGQSVQTKSYAPNSTSFNIYETFDRILRMGQLKAGDYIYRVSAEDRNGYAVTLIQSNFTIVDPAATQSPAPTAAPAVPSMTAQPEATAAPTNAPAVPAATEEPAAAAVPTCTAVPAETSEPAFAVSVYGEASPSGTYAVGTKFYFKGVLTSNLVMACVYGGIYTSDGSQVQCQSYSCGGTSFNIYETFDRMIRMGNLSAGEYEYRVHAVSESGEDLLVICRPFTMN